MRYIVLALVMAGAPLAAQTALPRRSGAQIDSAFNAHKNEFDYLLGDWEFTATSKQWGAFRGYWSAVKLDEGQILDEYRVVGDSGETYYVTATLRNYNGAADRWELIGADAGRGLLDFGTGKKVASAWLRVIPPSRASGITTSRPTAFPGPPTVRPTAGGRGSRNRRRSRLGGSGRRARSAHSPRPGTRSRVSGPAPGWVAAKPAAVQCTVSRFVRLLCATSCSMFFSP